MEGFSEKCSPVCSVRAATSAAPRLAQGLNPMRQWLCLLMALGAQLQKEPPPLGSQDSFLVTRSVPESQDMSVGTASCRPSHMEQIAPKSLETGQCSWDS